MGAWSEDIFGNDMACDIRAAYRERIKAGDKPDVAFKHIKREFAEPLRDADDKRVIYIALAAAQLELGNVTETIREPALKAIAWCEHSNRDPEDFPFGLEALAALREKLGGKAPPPRQPPKPKVLPGELGDVCAIALPEKGFVARAPKLKRIKEVVVFIGGPVGFDRSPDYGRVVWLPDLPVEEVTPESVAQALSEWRFHRQVWSNGLGRLIACYDANGKLPPRKTRVLLRNIPMPPEFARRMKTTSVVHKSSDIPYVVDQDLWDWHECEWAIDPKMDGPA